jgi:hypothetical protein
VYVFGHELSGVLGAEIADLELIDNELEVSGGMVEDCHALLSFERAGGE